MTNLQQRKGRENKMKNKFKKTIMVTGGAGFIGTNVVSLLVKKNCQVVVVDNFSNSYKKHINSVEKLFPENVKLIELDILNKELLSSVFEKYQFDAVIHLAGKKYVQESFEKQDEYYVNNIDATQILLEVMTCHNVKKLVFSSSITVYGNCKTYPIQETKPLKPLSPYAEQKALCEKMIKTWSKNKENSAVVLRLSNPVGANVDLMLGDDSPTKRQALVPYLIESGIKDKKLVLNGNNHPTRDGTTIRDYVHVLDVASAFVKAVDLINENSFDIFNIGTGGDGFTVLEILNQVEKTLKKKMHYSFGPKRAGDAAVIISDIKKAENILKFKPKASLKKMVETQLLFQSNVCKK